MVPRYWPSVGGAQFYARELIQRIGARHDVEVVTQFTSDRDSFIQSAVTAAPDEYRDGAIRVHRIGPRGAWRPLLRTLSKGYARFRPVRPGFACLLDLAIAPQLEAIVRRLQPEVIHAVHIGLVYSSETACRVARRSGVPFVWTPLPHTEGDTGWRGSRFRRLYRISDAVIAMTHHEKAWLERQGAPAGHVHVVPAGPIVQAEGDAQGFRREHGLGRAPFVLFLGQKLPYKGYVQMVQAAPLIWSQAPEARLVFIGPRTAESERFFALHQDPRIVELPAVDALEKSSALAACDVFCMPSVQESLGVVYLEAWSFRKPVIAADIHITREVIAEGQDGLLVEQEPQAIARATVRLLQDEGFRQRLGEKGHQKVRRKYDWAHLIDRMEALYISLCRQQFHEAGVHRHEL